jgi:hypothetical protein
MWHSSDIWVRLKQIKFDSGEHHGRDVWMIFGNQGAKSHERLCVSVLQTRGGGPRLAGDTWRRKAVPFITYSAPLTPHSTAREALVP